jgi:hypothetical protein
VKIMASVAHTLAAILRSLQYVDVWKDSYPSLPRIGIHWIGPMGVFEGLH